MDIFASGEGDGDPIVLLVLALLSSSGPTAVLIEKGPRCEELIFPVPFSSMGMDIGHACSSTASLHPSILCSPVFTIYAYLG